MKWLPLAGLGGLGASYAVGRALYDFSRPSDGEPIAAGASGTALVVLDAQAGFTRGPLTDALGEDTVAAALTRIDALAFVARRRGWPIVAARTAVRAKRLRLALDLIGAPAPSPNTPEARLDDRLELDGAEVFDKETGDALANPALDAYLRDRAVRRLLLTGLDGVNSVQRTARAALSRGYEVVLVRDAILSANPDGWAAWQDKLQDLGAHRTSVVEHDA